MFEDMGSNQVTVESQNAPNLAFYSTPVLGNIDFAMQVPQNTGEVKPTPPTIGYVSPESILYFSSMMNPLTQPQFVLGGSNTGQQVISGQITQQDTTGTSRYMQGYQSNNAGG